VNRKAITRMETILVTGGAGFIGSHLIEKLLTNNYRVICLDNFDTYYNPAIKRANLKVCLSSNRFSLLEQDIRNLEALTPVFKTNQINSVIHLAARAGVRPSIADPLSYQDVNIRGTINLLELSKQYHIGKFIFASSSSVYGSRSEVPFKETDCLNQPASPYAASKQAGELFCYTYHHLYHLPIACLRFFTVYGPRQRPDMAIHKFTRLIEEGKEIELFGDGSSSRDYTYISDIVNGIISALETDFSFEIFNLGGSRTITLKELVSLIEANLGKKAIIKPMPEQSGDVPITYADISKAEKLLDYKPGVPINEGIKCFIKWYRNGKE
jgi:UDP-glucuronate 4-epimerase